MRSHHTPRSRLSAFLQKRVTVPHWLQAILVATWIVMATRIVLADIERVVVVVAFITLLQVVIGGIFRRQDKKRGSIPEQRKAKTMHIRLYEARAFWNKRRGWTVWFMICVIATVLIVGLRAFGA